LRCPFEDLPLKDTSVYKPDDTLGRSMGAIGSKLVNSASTFESQAVASLDLGQLLIGPYILVHIAREMA
jgi:hypothetical protein